MSATGFFFTIEYGRVVVKFDGTHGGNVTRVVRDEQDLRQFLISKANEAKVDVDDLDLSASSTIDFPLEYTTDPSALAVARFLKP